MRKILLVFFCALRLVAGLKCMAGYDRCGNDPRAQEVECEADHEYCVTFDVATKGMKNYDECRLLGCAGKGESTKICEGLGDKCRLCKGELCNSQEIDSAIRGDNNVGYLALLLLSFVSLTAGII